MASCASISVSAALRTITNGRKRPRFASDDRGRRRPRRPLLLSVFSRACATQLRPALGRNAPVDGRSAPANRSVSLDRGRRPPADTCTLTRSALVASRFQASQYLSVGARSRRHSLPLPPSLVMVSVLEEEEDQSAFFDFSSLSEEECILRRFFAL